LRYPWAWARAVSRLRRLARRHHVVLSWQVKGNYYGTPAARLARKPSAWWDHGIRPRRGEKRYWIDNVLPRMPKADLVIASSQAAADRHENGRAIHPGISLEPYRFPDRAGARELLQVSSEPVVAIVGRLQPWKGVHVFLRAAAHVAETHPDTRFVVVGGTPGGFDTDYPDRLRALAKRLDIESVVWFTGQRDDVPRLLPGFDVFVNATNGEPFGLVTVEAMAAGVPVVATAAGGTLEIITDRETGLLVAPGDHESMGAAISKLLDDRQIAARIARAGRARAFEHFGAERFVRETEDLVMELASRT
jgi:glycosyltransferase involved in cell wall biosynthesis